MLYAATGTLTVSFGIMPASANLFDASMNILNGKLGAAATISYAQTQIPAEERNIGTAYCFATAAGDQKVEASISLYKADGTEVKTISATAVPVAANRQTNLKIN